MLSKMSEPLQHADWAKLLGRIEYALNNTISCSTKDTASKLLF